MGWKEKSKEWGGGEMSFLSEDGEAIAFVVCGEPQLLKGRYKGRESEKVGCPVVSQDGFTLFVIGKRLFRKISKYEERFSNTAFMAVRHGAQNEITSSYELKIIDDPALTKELFEIKGDSDYRPEIEDAVKAAEEVMRQ